MAQDRKYEWGEGVFTLLSWFRRERVSEARVLVAGAGALGNEVIKDLALFGVGHIYVVDFDRIEVSNLTRSVLFREEDAFAHRYKAEVAAARAVEINPQIEVTPIVGNLFSEVGLGLYRSVDVIIGCLDSPSGPLPAEPSGHACRQDLDRRQHREPDGCGEGLCSRCELL